MRKATPCGVAFCLPELVIPEVLAMAPAGSTLGCEPVLLGFAEELAAVTDFSQNLGLLY